MNQTDLIARLRAHYSDRMLSLPDRRSFILTGPTASQTLTLEIGDDAVRIFVSRIVHAEACDEATDVANVMSVIDALANGRADELYGRSPSGDHGFLGHEVFVGDETRILRIDEGAEIIHRCHLR